MTKERIVIFLAGVAFAYFLLPRITPIVYAAVGGGGE
jgi:hypothetical protein